MAITSPPYAGRVGVVANPVRDNFYDYSFSTSLPPFFTFTRASNGTYNNSNGILTTASTNVVRFNNSYDGVSWSSLGYLNETSKTNICKRSNEFNVTASGWSPTNIGTIVETEIGPDNTTSGWVLTDNNAGSTGSTYLQQTVTVSTSSIYTFSCYGKKGTMNWFRLFTRNFTTPSTNSGAFFDLDNGVVGIVSVGITATIENVGNGWFRCSITFTTDASDTSGVICVGYGASDGGTGNTPLDGTSTIQVYGAQFELAAYPSTYIETTSASVIRSTDILTTTDLDSLMFNAASGTVIVEFDIKLPPSGQVHRLWQADSGADTTATRINGTVSASGSTRMNGASTVIAGGTYVSGRAKAAFAWDGTKIYCCLNGGSVAEVVDTVAASFTTFRLMGGVGSTTFSTGTLKTLKVYPEKISSASMQAETIL